MRAFFGWTLALAASALLGITVYQAVLSQPLPAATAESLVEQSPRPTPTITQREVRTIVDPAPTVTVDEVVQVVEPAPVATPRRTARTATPATRATSRGEDDDDSGEPAGRQTRDSDDRASDDDGEDGSAQEASSTEADGGGSDDAPSAEAEAESEED